MPVQTVLVCEAQVPFVHGGAEAHLRGLVRELRARGFSTELVSVPFKWYPKQEVLPHAAAWRLLDLSESNGWPIDLVIASKFPTCKVAWLIHQYRAAYELCNTPYSEFRHTEADVGRRETLIRLDTQMLRECRAIYTNARNTSERVREFNALAATPLYHPPKLADVHPALRLIVAGDRTQRENLEREAERCGVATRVTFPGMVGDEDRLRLHAGALATVYPPFDEDFGYGTLESFLARKPVVTCADSSGPNEFVVDGVNGYVGQPDPKALASAINSLSTNRERAASMGEAGYEVARHITWEGSSKH